MKRLLLTILLLIGTLSSGCAIYHHYGSYYGKVMDAETHEPLEGAVVLADYVTWGYMSLGGPSSNFLDAQEAVTDKKGEFRIPSTNLFAFRPINLFHQYPYFTIFKPRYECYEASTWFSPNYTLPSDKYVTIELKKLKTNEERKKNIDCYPVSVPDDKKQKLIEVNNIERFDLGMQPGHVLEKK